MYDKTITLFNRYHSSAGDTWYPTVIHNVNLIIDKASIVARYGENNENSASLHIKFIKDGDSIMVGDKIYLEPKAWNQILNDELANYVTYKTGNTGDFFVSGELPEDIIDDNDFTEGFLSYANKHYDNVFVITSIGKYDMIPHFEILGK